MDMMKAYEALDLFKEMDFLTAGAVICTAIDIVASRNGMKSVEYVNALASQIKSVNEIFGEYGEE